MSIPEWSPKYVHVGFTGVTPKTLPERPPMKILEIFLKNLGPIAAIISREPHSKIIKRVDNGIPAKIFGEKKI